MSEYRVVRWAIEPQDPPMLAVAEDSGACLALCWSQADAERIARALALLDAREAATGHLDCPECAAGNTPHSLAHEGKP